MMEYKTLKETKQPPYIIRDVLYINCPGGIDELEMKDVVFNMDDVYIGDLRDGLTKEIMKLSLECHPSAEGHSVCSLGYSPKEDKWYGWSHRAMYGWQVGDLYEEGDSGFEYIPEEKKQNNVWKIGNITEAKEAAKYFAKSVSSVLKIDIRAIPDTHKPTLKVYVTEFDSKESPRIINQTNLKELVHALMPLMQGEDYVLDRYNVKLSIPDFYEHSMSDVAHEVFKCFKEHKLLSKSIKANLSNLKVGDQIIL